MSSASDKILKPLPWKFRILHVVRLAIGSLARVFFNLYYGHGKGAERIPPIADSDSILKESAVEVARKIRNKEITSVLVLETCIRRIRDVNSALNCFVEDRFDAALKEAQEADDLIMSGVRSAETLEKEKPFLGVPFTTKDCIGVKGMHQTAGVVLRKDLICEEDAPVIRLLREKGAIIIGLTNVPELCMWWETHNHIYGRTNNPYNTTRIVGGSSGGEGCLQASAGSIFGIGSDIGGSIRMPAYFNGIFGHKPSKFVVSNDGQYPGAATEIHNSFLGIGPMTRRAIDLKPIMSIISGKNSTKLDLDKPVDMKRLKVFYQTNSGAPLTDPVDADIVNAMEKVVEFLNVQHKIESEKKKIPLLVKSVPIWLSTMKHTKKFGEFILEDSSFCNIVVEIFKNFIGFSGNTLIGLFTALFDFGGVELGSEKYKHYLQLKEQLEKEFKDMLGDDGVFLYPTHPTPAPYHNEPLFKPMNFSYTSIINCLGLPATNVPLGLGREGLPIGIQVIANHNNDRLCLAVAEELDRAFGGWVEPQKL